MRFSVQFTPTGVLLVFLAAGCHTAHSPGKGPALKMGEAELSPFLTREDYTDKLGLLLHEVLANRGFTLPWTVVRGGGSSMWFVADRFKSNRRFDRLYVCIAPGPTVTATITPYGQGPTDWAILGRLFSEQGPEATSVEAASIASEIRDKLHANQPATK